MTPLERDDAPASQDASVLPDRQASLLEIANSGVTLLTWKRAEDGDGTILRLQETSGESSGVTIRSQYLTFERAWLCDLIEENQVEIKTSGDNLSVPIKPFQVLTLRIRTAPHVGRGNVTGGMLAGSMGFEEVGTEAVVHK